VSLLENHLAHLMLCITTIERSAPSAALLTAAAPTCKEENGMNTREGADNLYLLPDRRDWSVKVDGDAA